MSQSTDIERNHYNLVAKAVNTMRFYLLSLFAIVSNYGAQGCAPAVALAALAAGTASSIALNAALRSLKNIDPQGNGCDSISFYTSRPLVSLLLQSIMSK